MDGVAPLQTLYSSNKYNALTIRYFNVLTLHKGGNGLATVITSGGEYKKYSQSHTLTRASVTATSISKDPDNENYGAFVQLNSSYKNLFLTIGVRYEKNNLFKAALNPRLGLTTNFAIGTLMVKPRISWGKGIASPTYRQRFGSSPTSTSVTYANANLKPQGQQGFDYGLEFYDKKGRYQFEVVHYDNTLKDMIAQEWLGQDPLNGGLAVYMYKNVGSVANRGWEFSGEFKIRRFSLQGTFSIMNATIDDTTGAYHFPRFRGRAPGTRLIYLPRHTAGLNLQYNFYKLFTKADKGAVAINVTEVDGIKAPDRVNYTLDVAYGRTAFIPGRLSYDVENSGVFRVGLYGEYSITKNLLYFVQGSNILNSYKYEFYNDYATHGATWLFGLKYHFSGGK
jgi:outer membrane cobalamin receptor